MEMFSGRFAVQPWTTTQPSSGAGPGAAAPTRGEGAPSPVPATDQELGSPSLCPGQAPRSLDAPLLQPLCLRGTPKSVPGEKTATSVSHFLQFLACGEAPGLLSGDPCTGRSGATEEEPHSRGLLRDRARQRVADLRGGRSRPCLPLPCTRARGACSLGVQGPGAEKAEPRAAPPSRRSADSPHNPGPSLVFLQFITHEHKFAFLSLFSASCPLSST